MKVLIILTIFFSHIVCAYGQKPFPKGFDDTGTMFANFRSHQTYILFDLTTASDSIKVTKVTLSRSLFTNPQKDLFVEVYNVLFNGKDLAVFSVMPSLLHTTPQWKKIDIDTIKSYKTLSDIDKIMKEKFAIYPHKNRGILDNLKYFNYTLILKTSNGYYSNTTDCTTEFFTIIKKPDERWSRGFELNLKAKMLSTAEYESDYMRKHGGSSGNAPNGQYSNTPDALYGPRIYLSYANNKIGEYKYWLLDYWASDSNNQQRGMDRFIFTPNIGIVAAAYEFFMPKVISYYTNSENSPPRIDKQDFGPTYKVTPFFFKGDDSLLRYLTEDVLVPFKTERLR